MQFRTNLNQGFTLTELLVAIAIVAIISAIALPLYTQYSQRSYLAEVQSDLLNCGQALERVNAMTFSYAGTAVGGADAGVVDPDICDAQSVRNGRYAITINATPTTFLLTATAPGGSVMDGLGDLTFNNVGQRTWDENNNDDHTDANEDDWIDD